jgi:hypothetical protein
MSATYQPEAQARRAMSPDRRGFALLTVSSSLALRVGMNMAPIILDI